MGHKLRPKSDLDPAPFSYRYIYMGHIYVCAIFIRVHIYGAYIYVPFSYRYTYMGHISICAIFIQVHIYGAYINAPFSYGQGAQKLLLELLRHFHPGKELKDLGISGIFEPTDIFMKIKKSF